MGRIIKAEDKKKNYSICLTVEQESALRAFSICDSRTGGYLNLLLLMELLQKNGKITEEELKAAMRR